MCSRIACNCNLDMYIFQQAPPLLSDFAMDYPRLSRPSAGLTPAPSPPQPPLLPHLFASPFLSPSPAVPAPAPSSPPPADRSHAAVARGSPLVQTLRDALRHFDDRWQHRWCHWAMPDPHRRASSDRSTTGTMVSYHTHGIGARMLELTASFQQAAQVRACAHFPPCASVFV